MDYPHRKERIQMAEITLQGNELRIEEHKLTSTETVALPLDSLRLAYLFLPQGFKWGLVTPSKTVYRYLDLDSLTEAEYQSLYEQISGQWKPLWGSFKFVLKDLRGQASMISWKDLSRAGIDLMPALAQSRAARRAALASWLQGGGKVTIESKGLLGADVTLDAQGARANDRAIPWASLRQVRMAQVSQFSSSTAIGFEATKESRLKGFQLRVPGKQVEEVLAEVHFWQLQGLGAEGAAQARERNQSAEKAETSRTRRIALIVVASLFFLACVIMAIMLSVAPTVSRVAH
jgi:hypothetical protein